MSLSSSSSSSSSSAWASSATAGWTAGAGATALSAPPSASQVSSSLAEVTDTLFAKPNKRKLREVARGAETAARAEMLKTRRGMSLPQRAELYYPECPALTQLQRLERQVDVLTAKRAESVRETTSRVPERVYRKLRLFVYNEYDGQPHQVLGPVSFDPPSWTLRITGKLYDDESKLPVQDARYVVSNLFSRVVVQLDTTVFPDVTSTIEWRKSDSPAMADGFEVRRLGNEECDALITMYFDYHPPMFRLSKPLAALVGAHTETKACVLASIWDHIAEKGLFLLSEAEDGSGNAGNGTLRATVRCDDALRSLFSNCADEIDPDTITARVTEHLLPPDPVVIPYRISLSSKPEDVLRTVEVPVPLPVFPEAGSAADPVRPTGDMARVQKSLGALASEIDATTRKRDFMSAFAAAPAETMQAIMASEVAQHDFQKEEKKLASVSGSENLQLHEGFTFETKRWVPHAVDVYLEDLEEEKLRAKTQRAKAKAKASAKTGTWDIIVSTTGFASRELYEIREERGQDHRREFLTVGSMGHASAIAMGIALAKPSRQVICIDGDGAALMHMGALATIGTGPGLSNMKHILINNNCHDSVGGQPTQGFDVDFLNVAKACGYKDVFSASTPEEITAGMDRLRKSEGPVMMEVRCNSGARSNLGRPKETPRANKTEFMRFVEG